MTEFKEITPNDADYILLQSADPNIELIKEYISDALIIDLEENNTKIGCLVLKKISETEIEFKNIAIKDMFQNKGYGYKLLTYGLEKCKQMNYRTAIIGTGNSSIGQLYLYQKAGFEIDHIIKNFFVNNYTKDITENGILCKHMIVLKKIL